MWIEILAVVVVGIIILKFIFKPLLKLLALVVLGLAAWWLWNNGGF